MSEDANMWKQKYEEEYAIVDRVWRALGFDQYATAVNTNGIPIWEHVEELKRQSDYMKGRIYRLEVETSEYCEQLRENGIEPVDKHNDVD